MIVSTKDVQKVAFLARLHVPQEREEAVAQQLSNILGWIQQLSSVDTRDVAPLLSPLPHVLPQRDDVVTDGDVRDQVLANAPEADQGFFVVPKVFE